MKLLSRPLCILLILFIVALIPRLYHLDQTTIYPDEISWMVRGKETVYAISKLDFNYFNSVWWDDSKGHESIAIPLTIYNASSQLLLGKNQSKYGLNLVSDFTAARIPVATISSFLIPFFFLLAKNFIGKKISFLFAILLALDPIHLALSRWVMNDGLLTVFTFLSIYLFWKYRGRVKIIFACFSLAAACLTRPTGVITLVPWGILMFIGKDRLLRRFLFLSGIITLTYFFIWLFWIGMWQRPVFSYAEYFFREATLAQQGILVFFINQITTNPPPTYYLFQLGTRLPLPITLLLVMFPFFLFKKFTKIPISLETLKRYLPQIAFAAFSLAFFFALTFSALKIGVRYALPIWPWIYLGTAWTTSEILKSVKYRFLNMLLITILLGNSVLTLIKYFPDYYIFYNSLIGGPGYAQKYDMVGHCLGTKASLAYINRCYPQKSIAILGCSAVTAPYYFSGKISTDWRHEDITVVDYTYKQLLSNKEALENFAKQKPLYTSKSNEAILSEVYTTLIPPNESCF